MPGNNRPAGAKLGPFGALAAALGTVGLPFGILWPQAHAAYPHAFGRVMALVGIAVGVQAMIVGTARRNDPRWRWVRASGLPTAATCAAVAIAALSRHIIAEGQVTAMLAAVGYLLAGVVASLVETATFAAGVRSAVLRRAAAVAALIGIAAALTWRFPVVQFFDRLQADAMHPVHGGLYAYLAGIVSGLFATTIRDRWGVPAVTVALLFAIIVGYLAQSWFGAAVTMTGLGVALALRAWDDVDARDPATGLRLL